MKSRLITGIGQLVTNDPCLGDGSPLGILADAGLVLDRGRVAWVGPSSRAPAVDERVDVEGRCVVPGFVDSHTHVVFAGDRAEEFAARMAGQRYTGGGIAVTVAATRAASDGQLRSQARARTAEMLAGGTTTMEVKSGYALDVAGEARLLRLAAELTEETTFLGAHAVPHEFAGDRDGYVGLVAGDMLRVCAPLARWIDVFCDDAAFSETEARAVLNAGAVAGLGLRVHGNQLGPGPGVRMAVELGAASVDHCNYLTEQDVEALAGSDTVATLLPAADFSTRSPYPDARRLLDAGVAVALATDCNPGTSYVTSMSFVIALAVRELKMTPAEALHASTAVGARALCRDDIGSLRVGSAANLVVLDAPSFVHLAYRLGSRLTWQVWKGGEAVIQPGDGHRW